jgi:splicing factor 3B subunit 1
LVYGKLKLISVDLSVLLVAGSFPSARKVCDVYWKIYKFLYIGGQDALVGGYPKILNDPKNQYSYCELDNII